MSAEKDHEDESDGLPFLAPSTRPDSLGRLGHYEMLQVLGKGGFGIVFRAFDDMLQRVVAVKVMAPQMAATSPARRRFLREARSSAAGSARERGAGLRGRRAAAPLPGDGVHPRRDAPAETRPDRPARRARGAADRPADRRGAGRGPCVRPDPPRHQAGQHPARRRGAAGRRSPTSAWPGPPTTPASRRAASSPARRCSWPRSRPSGTNIDQRADLFSLGSVLYQMASGRPPFRALPRWPSSSAWPRSRRGPSARSFPKRPQWLCGIIAKLHAKNPDDRYQSAREVADVLADCEAQLKAHAKVKDFSRIPRGKSQRSGRWKWVVAAALVLLPLIGVGVAAWKLAGIQPASRQDRSAGRPGHSERPPSRRRLADQSHTVCLPRPQPREVGVAGWEARTARPRFQGLSGAGAGCAQARTTSTWRRSSNALAATISSRSGCHLADTASRLPSIRLENGLECRMWPGSYPTSDPTRRMGPWLQQADATLRCEVRA